MLFLYTLVLYLNRWRQVIHLREMSGKAIKIKPVVFSPQCKAIRSYTFTVPKITNDFCRTAMCLVHFEVLGLK